MARQRPIPTELPPPIYWARLERMIIFEITEGELEMLAPGLERFDLPEFCDFSALRFGFLRYYVGNDDQGVHLPLWGIRRGGLCRRY